MSEFDFKKSKDRHRKQYKYQDSPERNQAESSDVPTMLKKMQQQLSFLERKIDLLLGQSPNHSGRSEGHGGFFANKPTFSPRHGARDDKPGEKSFFRGKKPFPSRKRSRD